VNDVKCYTAGLTKPTTEDEDGKGQKSSPEQATLILAGGNPGTGCRQMNE